MIKLLIRLSKLSQSEKIEILWRDKSWTGRSHHLSGSWLAHVNKCWSPPSTYPVHGYWLGGLLFCFPECRASQNDAAKKRKEQKIHEAEFDELYAQIGRLTDQNEQLKKIWTLSCAWLDRYKNIHINHKAVYRHMGEMDSHGGISINIGYLSGTADEKSWPDQAAWYGQESCDYDPGKSKLFLLIPRFEAINWF